MKKLIFLGAIISLVSSVCFAQQHATPIQTAPKVTIEAKTLTGKVESVTLADPAKGTNSEIVVVDDNGHKSTFLVKSTTTINDTDWKAITLDKIKKDDLIRVKYTTKEGVNEAVSINLKKQ